MTNYSENPGSVRIERFKAGGKWYDTRQGDMSAYYWGGGERTPKEVQEAKNYHLIHEAVAHVIWDTFGAQKHCPTEVNWLFVVLDPYHENGYPIMLTDVDVWNEYHHWLYRVEQRKLGLEV